MVRQVSPTFYSIGGLASVLDNPIQSRRNPVATDRNYEIGQVWVNTNTAAVYIYSMLAGAPLWTVLGGPGSDVNTLTADAGGAITPTLNDIVIAGGRNIATTGTLVTSTISVDIDTGTAAARKNEISASGNAFEVYTTSLGIPVGTNMRSIQGNLLVVTGNGTESQAGIFGLLSIGAAANISSGFGGAYYATQSDGSIIANTLLASVALTTINEVNPADQPQTIIAGSQSLVSFGVAAGIPTASVVCATSAHVAYDPQMDGLAHGYTISRSGAGAGIAAGSAFKVIAGGAIVDWSYGLDLVTGGAGAAALYALGDIRLANGAIIDSTNATDTYITCPATGSIGLQLGDAAGADVFEWYSSTPAVVASMNSYGQLSLDDVLAGTVAAPVTRFTADSNIIQAYGQDTTAAGASALSAIYGHLHVTAGNGNHTPNATVGDIVADSGSNLLTMTGTYGFAEQDNGSIIASTVSGVQGHLNILEVNTADQAAYFAYGVKGYLDSTDGAGAPQATCREAAIGAIVEYNTPFNGAVYGVNVSRLDAGAGAGTAGLAAYGVTQGIRGAGPIADWLYGIDLYNGAAGVDYTNADIRLWNQALINSSASGVSFEAVGGDNWTFKLGDAVGTNKVSFTDSNSAEIAQVNSLGVVTCRSALQQNTNIPAFYSSPLATVSGAAGGVPSGVVGTVNLLHLQGDNILEEYMFNGVAGVNAVIVPVLTATGLEIGTDQIATYGAEYNFGLLAASRHAYVAQGGTAIFVEATFVVTTVANVDNLWLGFRKNAANNADDTAYTDAAFIGLRPVTAATVAIVGQVLNGGAWAYTNTTDAWANGATIKVRVNVSAAGIVSYLINNLAPTVAPAAFTFDAGDVIIPCIHIEQGAAAFTTVKLVQFACGLQ